MTNERNTLETTLEEAQREVILENKRLPSSDQLPIPTRRLVHSLIQGIRADDRCVARYGRDAAMKQFRAMLAHRLTDQPLERAEIDHTVLDIMVVDNETGMPLGRPFLTACIDDNTRSVLGIHVGFTPPSYLSVAKCLQHAFLPKSNLKDGNPDLVNDWTAFGVMRELVVDNGAEFHSDSLENTCFLLGIELHYSARKTPWFKGKIERFLGSLNRGVAHGNPGTTFGDIFEKGDYDPKKNAVIRLDALRRAIHLWIVDYYHQKPHSVLKMSPEDAWRSRIALEDIRLPADVQMMDAIVGKSLERVLTHKGIEYNKLFYNSAELKELRSRMGSRLDVDIRVNTENIGQIHVISPDKRNTFVVPAIDYEYAEGMTEWQHELCKKYAARHMHRYDDKNGWLDAKEKIRRIFGTEKQWKKQTVRRQKAAAKKERMGNDTEQTDLPQSSSDEYQPALHAPTATELSMPNQETYEPVEPRTPKRFGAIQQTRHQYFLNTETLK